MYFIYIFDLHPPISTYVICYVTLLKITRNSLWQRPERLLRIFDKIAGSCQDNFENSVLEAHDLRTHGKDEEKKMGIEDIFLVIVVSFGFPFFERNN